MSHTARATTSAVARASEWTCASCRWQQSAGRQLRDRRYTRQARPVSRSRPHLSKAGLPSPAVQFQHRRQAHTVSLASSTAINAPSQTPQKYRQLYDALSRLQEDAGAYIDLSRVSLALKSYESEHPALRIGFLALGEDGAIVARNLARTLCSDALGEEQAWERELVSSTSDGRSVLLRYGETDDVAPGNAFMRTILIPSPYLLKHKLEILIAPLHADFMRDSSTTEDIEDTLLVPSLTIPASGGRVGFVRNPVHKTLVIGKGVSGAIQLGRLNLPKDNTLISAVIDMPEGGTGTVDTKRATAALESFRADQASGASFGTNWLASQVPEVSSWLTANNSGNELTVATYTANTLSAVQQAIDKSANAEELKVQSSSVSDAQRVELRAAIQAWSADAHNDLRHNLLTALESRPWRRTAWFRLLWRIDDVSYSCTDILNQCWLNETEQRLAFLSGRIRQAGLATEDQLRSSQRLLPASAEELLKGEPADDHTTVQIWQVPALLSDVHKRTGLDLLFRPPWPQTINLARQYMLHTDVPDMHRKAQGLVLSTLTTTGATSALGVWLWAATSGVALYEAGAIAAFGIVWSLRRLQRLWGKERDNFSATIQENGRKVLVEIESRLFSLVQDGGKATQRPADVEALARARAAVEKCRAALAEVA